MSAVLPTRPAALDRASGNQSQRVTLSSATVTLLAMLRREMLVAGKQFHVTASLLLLQPALLLFALGRVQSFIGGIPASFVEVLLPGILGSVILSFSVQSVSAPLIAEFSYTREIEDRLLSPIPVWLVGIEKILAGTLKSFACAVLYFPLAWVILGPALYHVDIHSYWLLAITLLLSSLAMSALGLLIGSATRGAQSNIVFTVLLVPMSFLGCVYFPWAALAPVPLLQSIALLDPQTYMSELLRATMTADPHMSFLWAFGGMLIWTALFFFLGLRTFIRRAIQ
ncbi:MAG TPA: ABC transporter permease [Ktedonobacteraceae bacterium]|nr:ABC transporter permease [Ktedonobacteraceae bacterium]